MPTPCKLSECWAKTDPVSGKPALTVRDHCLIVGAVAEAVKRLLPAACQTLVQSGAVTLAAAHDIGKITPGFQLKARPHWDFPNAKGGDSYQGNHSIVSQAYLASLDSVRVGRRPFDWVLAAGGHHGKYWASEGGFYRKIDEDGLTWPPVLRDELLQELEAVFGKLPSHDIPKGSIVHWLTGFITFSDWIGSDTRWFPLSSGGPLADRETPAAVRENAAKAIADLGWHQREVHPHRDFSALFPSVESPRPLQSTLIAAMDAPGLYIVEAPMGVGKTEAALAACYRRWREGEERGLYFALPTQLTSNRIHTRVGGFLKNVVSDSVIASLVHGNAWMNPDRIVEISPTIADEEDAAKLCEWYASGRKSLLAPFGSGTIDQAIMSCLPVKHSALRLFALSGKMVIIDEVHSYDPYTSVLVDRTVKWLIDVGCSVIVLSATLASSRRKSLVAAVGAAESGTPTAYPLITKVAKGSPHAESISVTGDDLSSTEVTIERVASSSDEIWQKIAAAAESGACVVVIRNTVKLAQDTYRQLKSRCRDQGITFGLIHSRFPQFQRDENEKSWMEKLGKTGDSRPQGCILVATQVVEQSVDIDADLLVTDLAPVDLILQRLGRLHRHPRSRPAGFETPRGIVLMPQVDWTAPEIEIKSALGPSAWVYPPFSLYLAARVISELPQNTISLPRDIRDLVEKSSEVPETLESGAAIFREHLDQETRKMLNTARMLDVFNSATYDDKEGARTRWNNQPTALLVLLRQPFHAASTHLDFCNDERITFQQGSYGPFNYPLALALHRNAIRIPRYLVRHLKEQPAWLGKHCSDAVLAIVPADTTACELIGSPETPPYLLDYHPETGLSHTRNPAAQFPPSFESEDDGWF
ncbi:MAG: CRISPR-associated helicase Cas3' [Luteolibacter sp.]|uniref:CRISPR-associated helicase Cas3' n=1 Tax=Luteolibacter sp. TaxID=1962973 RepID=UPI0032649F15